MGTMLNAAGAKGYDVTQADKLWLLRAVAAEGEPRQSVAHALVSLFMLSRSRGATQSLASLVRAYAQPVNPRWYPGGDLFERAAAAMPSAEARMALRQAEKRRDLHSTRTVFTAGVREAVENALTGEYRGDVTDYAAPSVDATAKGYVARSEPQRGVNRLWTRSPGWTGYVTSAARATLPVALVLLAVLTAGVMYARG